MPKKKKKERKNAVIFQVSDNVDRVQTTSE